MIQHTLTVTQHFHDTHTDFFASNDHNYKMEVLKTGLLAHASAQRNLQSTLEDAQSHLHQEELDQLRDERDKALQRLQHTETRLQDLQSQHHQDILQERQQERILQQQVSQDEITRLQHDNQRIHKNLQDMELLYQKKLDERIQHIQSMHTQQLQFLQDSNSTHHATLQDLLLKLQKKEHNNKTKGSEGQDTVLDFLKPHFPSAQLELVDHVKHSGDIKLVYQNTTILLEIRNYQNSVSQERRNTLVRDVEKQHADAGILVSLHSGIVGREDLEMEITPSKKLLVYCHRTMDNPHKIIAAIQTILQASHNLNHFEEQEKQSLLENILLQQSHIKDLETQHKTTFQTILSMKKHLHNCLHTLKKTQVSNDPHEMTKSQLVDLCKKRNLPHSGSKKQLIQRLTV